MKTCKWMTYFSINRKMSFFYLHNIIVLKGESRVRESALYAVKINNGKLYATEVFYFNEVNNTKFISV